MISEIVISKHTGTIIRIIRHIRRNTFSGVVIGIDMTKPHTYESVYQIGEYSETWNTSSFEPYGSFNNTIKII